jgi:hypothetical protein
MAKREDQEYLQIALETYRLNVDRLKLVMQLQADYGKWLVATLAAVHSAAIYAIATHTPPFPRPLLLPFMVGIALTLVSGLCTWANFTIAIRLLEGWTDPASLMDDARYPTKPKGLIAWSIPVTMVGALISGISSGGCILWGAWLLYQP